jgi:hypothetical protein
LSRPFWVVDWSAERQQRERIGDSIRSDAKQFDHTILNLPPTLLVQRDIKDGFDRPIAASQPDAASVAAIVCE